MRWIVALLNLITAHAVMLNTMPEVVSSAGVLNTTLVVNQYFFNLSSSFNAKFWTRLYNPPSSSGNILHPGPTIKIKRGDKVTITLQNDLGPETGSLGNASTNSFHYANVTNLHTHGLHISAESPQDNVLMGVHPGESFTYIYDIPSDHAAGTYWYHAHHHGSTALQVGGGLLGALIMLDDCLGSTPDLPAVYCDLPEQVLVLSHIPVHDLLNKYQSVTGDDLYRHKDNWVAEGAELILVNGQDMPTIPLEQGRWTRLRLIFTSLKTSLGLQMTSNAAGCAWLLLAKDGIYVESAPRLFGDTIYLAPGGRVDVLMKCSSSGVVEVGSAAPTTSARVVLVLAVAAAEVHSDPPLPLFSPRRPDNLADLRAAPSPAPFSLELAPSPGSCTLNGRLWDGGATPAGTMTAGSVQRWDLRGLRKHPFHMHVNSFQLADVSLHPSLSPTAASTGFFVSGDWHDVLLPPLGVQVDTVLFAVDSFVTKSVLHCHFLTHEDLGCMGFMAVTGSEGASSGLQGSAMSCLGPSTAGAGGGGDVFSKECEWLDSLQEHSFLTRHMLLLVGTSAGVTVMLLTVLLVRSHRRLNAAAARTVSHRPTEAVTKVEEKWLLASTDGIDGAVVHYGS